MNKEKLNQKEWDIEKNRVRDMIEEYTRFMWNRFFKMYELTKSTNGDDSHES